MGNEQSIKRYIIRDVHGNILKENGFSVVGDVHVTVEPGYGEPSADVEYVDGELYLTLHNIEGNGITEIVTQSQEGDEAVNTVTIKTDDNPEGVVLEVRNGSRGNGIASSSETLSPDDGGTNTHTFVDTDGNSHVFHTKNGHKGEKGEQGDSVLVGQGDLPLAHALGYDNTKAISQKGVTEAFDSYQVNQTEYGVGRLFSTGINATYTSYRYLRFDVEKGDVIHYKAMADSSTGIIGRKNANDNQYTLIASGTGTTNYVEGDLTVPADGTYAVCGYNNKDTVAVVTKKARLSLLEDKVEKLQEDYEQDVAGLEEAIQESQGGIQSAEQKITEIKKELGIYKVDENIISSCLYETNSYVNYSGDKGSGNNYRLYYIPVENATELKLKGGFGANTSIAFYSGLPIGAGKLVELHKFTDYANDGIYSEEITLNVPTRAKYFAFSLHYTCYSSAYLKVSAADVKTNSLNERVSTLEDTSESLELLDELGIYKAGENIFGKCSIINRKYINYNGGYSDQDAYKIYYVSVENATVLKVKGAFGANTSIGFYSSYPFDASSLVELHKNSEYQYSGSWYTDEITLNVPAQAKYFAFSIRYDYVNRAYLIASSVNQNPSSLNTRITVLEKNSEAFAVDQTLRLQGITDNPLALVKETGGLASAFDSWGFVGDSIASGEIWGYINEPQTLTPSMTDKIIDASRNIINSDGYVISAPMQGTTYRPKFVVEFENTTGLSSSMCVIVRSDANGNLQTDKTVGSSSQTKYTLQLTDNQYAVICYPANNVPSVRCVRYHVEDNYDISWGQHMLNMCHSTGKIYAVGGGTAIRFAKSQSPYPSDKTLGRLLSDSQKQGYIIGLGVNDKTWAEYDALVTDSDNIGDDINLNDCTQNANTYAGWYARIIQSIKDKYPDSFIFLVTVPNETGNNFSAVNEIIRAMPDILGSKYNSIYVIDLETYLPTGPLSQFHMNGIHFNGQGYLYFAYVFCTYIEWLMRKYPSDFKRLSLVGKALLNDPT